LLVRSFVFECLKASITMEESGKPAGEKLKVVTEKVKGGLGGLLGSTHKSHASEQEREGAGAGHEGFFGADDAAHRGRTGVYGEAGAVEPSDTGKVGFMDKVKDTLTGQTPTHGTAAGTATTGDGTGYGTVSRSSTTAAASRDDAAAGGLRLSEEDTHAAGATRGAFGGGGPETAEEKTTLAGAADSRQAATGVSSSTGMSGHDTRLEEQERKPTTSSLGASGADMSGVAAQGYSSSAAGADSTVGSTEAGVHNGWPRPTKPATSRDSGEAGNVQQTPPDVKAGNVKKEGVVSKLLEKLHLHSPKKGPSGSPAA
jgi:hypothetical protein